MDTCTKSVAGKHLNDTFYPGSTTCSITASDFSLTTGTNSQLTRGLSTAQKFVYSPIKYIDIYNAMRGYTTAIADTAMPAPAMTCSVTQTREPSAFVRHDTQRSSSYYHPISSGIDLYSSFPKSTAPKSDRSSVDAQSILSSVNLGSLSKRVSNIEMNNSKRDGKAVGKQNSSLNNPDENNNFMIYRRGQLGQRPQTWADEQVTNRIEVLAQPKKLPPEYQEDRRSVYWVAKRPSTYGSCNHTHFETSQRIDELAQPRIVCGEFCGIRHCYWECEYPHPPCSDKDPREVDWCRLAMPKQKYPPNYRAVSHVRKSALRAEPTKRLCKLSIPKPVIDSDKFYLWLWHKKPDTEMLLKKVSKLPITKCHMPDMRIMIRCDLDPRSGPPIEEKVRSAVTTVQYALDHDAQSVVIVASVAPDSGSNSKPLSLRPMVPKFEELLGRTVLYLNDCTGYQAVALCEDPEPGTVFLMENFACHPEETGHGFNEKGEEYVVKSEVVEKFRERLFNTADTYVVDAFPQLVHMTNTTIGYPKQEKAYGFNIKFELDAYNRYIVKPQQPMVAIVGGDFYDKAKLVRNLMGKASEIILGHHIASIFLKALKNVDIGTTKFTRKMLKMALKLHTRAKDTKTAILLPSDVVVRHTETEEFYTALTREDIDEMYDIVDIGPFTRKCYVNVISRAHTILWAGEMGLLSDGTNTISAAFSNATENGVLTYIADEETKAAFSKQGASAKVTHMSYDGEVTMMLLKGKLPKGLRVLNPYRRKVKKRTRPEVEPSKKPVKYEIPGMQIASGEKIMCINDIDVEDKKVLIRVDFDVPVAGQQILNNYRIRMTIPTIKYAIKWRAKVVIILGHMGNPEGFTEPTLTLKPVCDELACLLGQTVIFVPQSVGDSVVSVINQAHSGTVMMLENIRFHQEETGWGTTRLLRKKIVTPASPEAMANFCEKLTNLGNVYVNDAFACLHKDHSSIMSYYLAPRTCGFLVKNELKYMAKIFNYPRRRFMIVLGGKNIKEKMPILKDLMKEADNIILTGLFGPAFLKVIHNASIGATAYDPVHEKDIRAIAELSEYYHCRLHYPVDFLIAPTAGGTVKNSDISETVPDTHTIVDIGYLTSSMFGRLIKRASMVLWVGTAGMAEKDEYAKGTKAIMDAIVDVTNDPEKNAISIVAGVSNCEYIHRFDPDHTGFTHLTTGGPVALKLLTERQLIGVDVLTPKASKRPLNLLSVEALDVAGKRILMRADLNMPVKDEEVEDAFPLKNLVATIKLVQKRGAKSVVLVGHRGRPQGKRDETLSLKPVQRALEKLLEQDVTFIEDGVCDKAEQSSKVEGRVVLVENVRFHPEEEGITDGPGGTGRIKVAYDVMDEFRTKLSALGDIFVNEAFCSLYHPHCSVVGILDKVQKVAGPTLKREVSKYVEIRNNMERPFLLIMGGDDVVENMPRLYRILDFVDQVIVCGDIAFTLLKANQNVKLGKAPVDKDAFKLVPRIMKKAKVNGVPIIFPADYVCGTSPDPPPKPEPVLNEDGELVEVPEQPIQYVTYTVEQGVPEDCLALDLGSETIGLFNKYISEAKTIIWDGIINAYYEYDKFQEGTKAIIQGLQKATNNGAVTIALGIKTGICVSKMDATEACGIYSTGVQSCLDILRKKTLPGLLVLQMTAPKPLRKLSIDKMTLKGMRVLMRLDLFVPTVEGVVLDTDKLEEAAPTIQYALNQGAKSVVLLGHRGNPDGFKNHYLRMEPLVVELSQILERDVTFIDRPSSNKAKNMLADPKPGSVFLMENLKFYPAEYGRDAEPRELKLKKKKDDEDTTATDFTLTDKTDRTITSEKTSEKIQEKAPEKVPEKMPALGEEDPATEADDDAPLSGTESTMSVSDAEGGKSIDSLMYQLMAPKTVAQFKEDIATCGDVFVNDDVTDLEEQLTSLEGFGLQERGCGFLVMQYIQDMDDPSVYTLPGIAPLSPVPL